jgi:hypothetical protein
LSAGAFFFFSYIDELTTVGVLVGVYVGAAVLISIDTWLANLNRHEIAKHRWQGTCRTALSGGFSAWD